jgi:aspartyl-tRNA(Asn)/glutamyl-tRNA(Gln) amidotransferase subunit B
MVNKNYETVVGLEIHTHLKTESKMFCRCATGPRGKDYKASEKDEPNIRNCPVCTGQPGTLPVPNKKAIEDTILLGLALGSKISPLFNFERKNYFYPDLPKAYQITSATNPPVIGGGLEIEAEDNVKFVELDHIHLEEDAGKLTHDAGGEFSLVDLNRAGTPLLEIITQPVLSSGPEAVEFIKNLQAIIRYLGISDADMEKGQLRCDANISVRERGEKKLGTKVEIKNMNSFKMIARAIEYESKRQVEALESGERLEQETRGWDDNKGKTLPQRSKEFANDYRYFPEPDIPPIEIGPKLDLNPDAIKDRLPELPKEKKARFKEEYGLNAHESAVLTENVEVAKYFEDILVNLEDITQGSPKIREFAKITSGLLMGEFLPRAEEMGSPYDSRVTTEMFAKLVGLIDKNIISGKIAKEVFPEMFETGQDPEKIIETKGMRQISDTGELEKIIKKIIAENASQAELYRSGKEQIFGFFVGQVMKATKGQANPKVVNDILKEALK